MKIFPQVSPNYSLHIIPKFSTVITNYGNAVEQRISLSSNPQYVFEVNFKNLHTADKKLILDFFISVKGNYEAFYFSNLEEAYGSAKWVATTLYTLGDIVRPSSANRHSYKCTTIDSTSGSSEPPWTTVEGTVMPVDGTVVWIENSYKVRFESSNMNIDYFSYKLYNLNSVVLLEVA